ncbi:hypothetical protein Har1130_17870 [Haloarcula sp. CBA1130]|uniref:hypothetical protein n=1 Tax=unclassified Haloarcula TaxID=2624677 RepID=UPI00127C0AC3|nr:MULTISPECIES: hypothetical protein [unclassified Haloarcula]KAA9396524.1 hypothetical protein Har1130_17870 [Haloarcula sp. CBA1130]KAA9397619.1 hypothetical protein Har1129_04935 [Haloarcula sp. CBA1129]
MSSHTPGDGETESQERQRSDQGVGKSSVPDNKKWQSNAWYEIPAGQAITILGIFLTLFAVTATIKSLNLLAEDVGIPFDVYLYGFFGAMARSLLVFVTNVNPDTDSEAVVKRSWMQIVRLGLRLFGALCLGAGIYLANNALDNALVFTLDPPEAFFSGLAFLAGFYVERAYRILGTVAKRLLSLTDQGNGKADTSTGNQASLSLNLLPVSQRPDEPRWYSDTRSLGLFVLGLVLLSLGIIASLGGNILPLVPSVTVPVPSYVYLYALLGSLGYLFTTLFKEFDRNTLSLVQKGIRIPAALLLAAGFYMFSFLFITGESTATGLISGLAFLVGLYVNVALVTLDTIASRVLSSFSND